MYINKHGFHSHFLFLQKHHLPSTSQWAEPVGVSPRQASLSRSDPGIAFKHS